MGFRHGYSVLSVCVWICLGVQAEVLRRRRGRVSSHFKLVDSSSPKQDGSTQFFGDAEVPSELDLLFPEDRVFWNRILEDSFSMSLMPTPAPTFVTCKSVLWSDEFNSPSLDDTIWSYDLGVGDGGFGNLELQTYTNDPSNIRVQDGSLIITARESNDPTGRQFTSARIRSEDTVEVLYGNLEARIKIPDLGNGLWPAFWTLGGNYREVNWPMCGEIDTMEMGSAEAIEDGVVNRRVTSAAQWEIDGSQATFDGAYDSPNNLNDDEFHTYRLEWTPTRLATFVDNNFIWEMDISPEACTDCTELHQPHFLLLNMAVGGTFTGILNATNITASLPAEMLVDYVRVCDNGSTVLSGTVVEEPVDYSFDCGIPELCTKTALNNYAGEFTCGARMAFLIENEGFSEREACRQVAGNEFPAQCGVCVSQVLDCDLPNLCTDAVLDTNAGGFSCRDRISFLVSIQGHTQRDACNRVAGVEFPVECGPCNPIDCDLPDTCTNAVLDTDTEGPTCRDRITFLVESSGFSETEACNQVAGVEFPIQCGQCNPIDCDQPNACTNAALDADADGFSCRDRITFLIQSEGLSEIDACNQVAGFEFPSQCGACSPIDCDQPELCTNAALDADADGFSCRDRITFLIQSEGFSEIDACNQVAGIEFPSQCGACNPIDCNQPTCTDAVLNADADGPTCGDRITFLIQSSGFSELDACSQIAGVEFPTPCGGCNPP